jgi:hypothetical protein
VSFEGSSSVNTAPAGRTATATATDIKTASSQGRIVIFGPIPETRAAPSRVAGQIVGLGKLPDLLRLLL